MWGYGQCKNRIKERKKSKEKGGWHLKVEVLEEILIPHPNREEEKRREDQKRRVRI